ncbi:SpoIIE family protein phosphatase [Geodermatophilus sp. DSM 44513]|uniref:PP2C family protein-serine/threonine phosphatase n=1 Tax=Geodermatophilus sp. DSM 44513 TaxID=1528104 RepID=UPI00126F8422|nr:SpoIIE family protein phosphatase [Geodermatophilus sp. DSM 44513]WNV75583.1 SpoIIE family protein phosphatase [Geodermatophilus sp. DSM 44513]
MGQWTDDAGEVDRQAGLLRALFAGDAVGMAAGSGEAITQANDELLRILGRSRADVDAGLAWPAITPTDHAERDAGGVDDVRRTGSAVVQKDFLRPDGSRTPVLAAVAAVSWNPYEWVAVVIDLSQQERLRRLVQSEAAIVSTLLEDAPVGFALIDPDLRFVRINRELAAMNGFPVAEHEGRSVFDLLPDLRAEAEPLLRHVLETGEPLRDVEIVGTTPADPGHSHTWLESFFPVRVPQGPTIGVAAVARDVTAVRRLEQELTATLDRQRQVLHELQTSVLPELPDVPGVDLAARYLGASQEVHLGGDWFDVFTAPDGRLVLAVGDVVGHGPAAVGLMARLSGAVRAYAGDGRAPAEVLAGLNRLLDHSLAPAMASAAMVFLDVASGEVEYASAGHPHPLLCGRSDAPEVMDRAQGRMLGASADSAYPTGHATLVDGATVLLYTDGLVERRGQTLDEGMARLTAAVTEHCGTGRDAGRLVHAVVEHSHTALDRDDDVCVLAARRVSGPQSPPASA